MTPDLLPCPFCGGQPTSAAFPGNRNTWCSNQPRDCHNTAMYSREQWNTRAKSAPAEVAQGEAVGIPVAAQARFRRPEKGTPDWSPWQPAAVRCSHPTYYVDTQGWETEYRLLYTAPPSPDAELIRQCIEEELESWMGDYRKVAQHALCCLKERIDAKLARLTP